MRTTKSGSLKLLLLTALIALGLSSCCKPGPVKVPRPERPAIQSLEVIQCYPSDDRCEEVRVRAADLLIRDGQFKAWIERVRAEPVWSDK